jgi:D-arabinose 1-dehydrogenase-like Zn-dependent alcohol dehydrogenase
VVIEDQVLTGELTGSARDTEKTMRFAQTRSECRMVGRTPLTQANEALQRIGEGKSRFLIVVVPGDPQ